MLTLRMVVILIPLLDKLCDPLGNSSFLMNESSQKITLFLCLWVLRLVAFTVVTYVTVAKAVSINIPCVLWCP